MMNVDVRGNSCNLLGMRLSIGNGGWVGIDGLDLPGPLYVRVRDVGGRLRVAEFYLDASDGADVINTADLHLPLARIEAMINRGGDAVRARADLPSPDLATLASYYATTFGKVTEGDWVAESFASQQIPRGVNSGEVGGVRVKRVKRSRRKWEGVRDDEREFRLASGPTEGLSDEFLRSVARAYTAAVMRGERPNKAIAEQTGYPVKTVQRWVYLARKSKIMPPGQKGRAG